MGTYSHLQEKLETELPLIVAELKTIAIHNPETNDWVAVPVAKDLQVADINEEADAVEEWSQRRALMSQLETRYRNIVRALEKFSASTYGICEVSGEEIERERLEANPAARTNIAHIEEESSLPT